MEKLKQLVVSGNTPEAEKMLQRMLEEGGDPETITREALIPAMDEVGDLVQDGKCYLPDMLVAAKAMNACMAFLKPYLTAASMKPMGKVVLGTVQGDLHDIGKNLVGIVFEGAGFEVIDLGVDVAPEEFVATVEREKPNFVGLSALLTTTMLSMQEVIEALEKAGFRRQVKVIVGGAPVTREFADTIGADFYAPDATSGKEYARQ